MALTLAIGFLVVDAIVFLENTVRRMERGERALEATLNSTREISFTIFSMTISLAAVFLPLVVMPGLVGRSEPAERAIHDPSLDRFRPIIMTTLAAVAGAVPIAVGVGGASRRALGLVIVEGLMVSQLITLYVTPVIYLYLERFQTRVRDRMSFFRSAPCRAAAGLEAGDTRRAAPVAGGSAEGGEPDPLIAAARHGKMNPGRMMSRGLFIPRSMVGPGA